jgi:small-conductance mechanosensitive channel
MMDKHWNFTSYEKYINQRFCDAEKAVKAALAAAEKAIDKAQEAQQLRNAAQNEFRASLSDLSGHMATKESVDTRVESLRRELSATDDAQEGRIRVLETANANIQGRIWVISALWAVIVLVSSFAVRFIGHS